ncbi:SpvB/TcaC N-terminal domain-containing protein [Streptomyces tunisiensis]|uniref:SpvB/TcaC N-terminal domain-containing protein n=1 Tax=Streptomyces tunisiensis TaxID=948699 RepID=UPI003EE0D1B5
MGAAFGTDEFTGVAALQVPVASSQARGFAPQLALSYSSHDGPSPYGLGFSVKLPRIARRNIGVPRYDDSDYFELTGQGDLVPLNGQVRTEQIGSRTYTVASYAPRLQEAFDTIECWTDETGETFWRTVDAANVTSLYGRTELSRISDPRAPQRVAEWLLDVSFDAEGKAILAEYLAENTENVRDAVYEVGREQTANRYPSRLRYGNTVPYLAPPFGVGPPPATGWLFDLVFDYGQYEVVPTNPNPSVPVRPWPARLDPFSRYETGFEVRTHRLCRNLLTFHTFPELGPDPVLTHNVRLGYDETPSLTTLVRVESIGYAPDHAPDAPAPYRTAQLPPLDFRYLPFRPTEQGFEPVLDEQDRPLSGLGEAPSAWVDMLADGLPGVLYADGESVLYRTPRSVDVGPVRLGPPRELEPFPVERVVAAGTVRLLDLDGDMLLEILVARDGETGVYKQREDGSWVPFTPLPGAPSELTTPGAAFTDLSGTGRSDLVVLTPERVRVYPGEGDLVFGEPVVVQNDAAVPPLVPAEPSALVSFGDVLGSGSTQVVRIADGSVQCWPSLGRGVFAPVVTLAGAPRFGADADLSRIFLVDLDGSGPSDLVYADGHCLRVWLNQSGSGFADPIEIPLPTAVTSAGQVRFADVRAVGVPSVLVSDVLGSRTWSCSLVGETQPYLLHEIDNHLGALTRVGYRSSVAYRLEDERAGIPWRAYLPFPVQVVASIEQVDEVSETRLVTRYRYRHGCYDPVLRQFRGFGLVERRNADRIDTVKADAQAAAFAVPPLLVKTWYHLGAWLGADKLEEAYRSEFYQGDPLAYRMPDSVEIWPGPPPDDSEAHRQAAVALAGRPLRTERYGEDGSPEEPVPYDVSEQNYEVVMRQAPSAQNYGVYSVREREAFGTDYERNAADPVMTQRAALAYDAFDNATRTVVVHYPRRSPVAGALPEQQVLRIRFELDDFVNESGSEPHFVGLPYQARSLEALGIPEPVGYFDVAGLANAVGKALDGRDGASARLYDWRRRYYAAADGSEAPLGSSGPQLLLRRDTRAFAEKSWLRTLFAPVLDTAALETVLVRDGRFTQEPGTDYWWQPGAVRTYATLQDFFVPTQTADALGATLTFQYDPYHIATIQVTERATGLRDQRVRVDTFDYTKLVPTKVTDINDNVGEVLLDPLARVVRTSRYGEEDGVRVGFAPLAGNLWPEPAGLTDLVDNTALLLGEAESLYYYDPHSWDADRQPATVARAVAQEYPGPGTPPPWLTSEYADGFGRVFERKIEAEPSAQDGPRRWITSGRIRFNAGGSPYKKYEPYYSDSYRSSNDADPAPADVALVLTHDALDRLVRIDAPLGVHTTLARSTWGEVESDFCDTVRDSRYWAEHIADGHPMGLDRYAGQALLKSALAAGTPTTRSLDNRGRVVARTVQDNATATAADFAALGMTQELAVALLGILQADGFLDFRNALTIAFQPEQPGFALHLPQEYQPYETGILRTLDGLRDHGTPLASRFAWDAGDNQILAVDPRLSRFPPGTAANFRRTFALDGSTLRTVGADGGTRYVVPDFRGRPVLQVDGAGTATSWTHDALGRLSTVVVREGDGSREWTAERWIYGDTVEADHLAAAAANLNGRLWRVFDESGLVEYTDYTLTGGARRESRRFLTDPASPDWTVQNATPDSPLLESTEYPLDRQFDALGRIRAQRVPDGDRLETQYLLSGRVGATALVTADGRTLPCVVSAAYSAKGQPVEIAYGNGVVTRYGYDRLTAALATIRTTRRSDGAVLQDLTIYRDVMGNVTHLTDAAFGPLFKLPPGFDADCHNDYDALYRVVRSSGVERAGRGVAADREGGYAGLVVPWTASGVDPGDLAPYRRLFAYDVGGNLYAVVHESATSPWFGQLVVSDGSNRAVEAAIFGGDPGDPLIERVAPAGLVDAFFDPNGNQTRLLGIEAVDWTYRNQIDRLDVADEHDRYGYDALARRVRVSTEGGGVRREVFEVGPWSLARQTSSGSAVVEHRRLRVVSESLLVAEYVTDGRSAQLVFDLSDPLRSIALQLGEHGTLLSYEAYVPYGATAFAIAPDQDSLDGKVERYSTEPRDRSSGLCYYGARYLAPWSGRWSNPDPDGPVDGLNLYAFVTGNPTSAVDRRGTVKVMLDNGTEVEISPEEILAAYHVAADQLAAQQASHQIMPNGSIHMQGGREMPIYLVEQRGQLFGLAFQQRGDPITGMPVTSFRLNFGNLETTMQKGLNEPGVHLGVTIGSGPYDSAKPEYGQLDETAGPRDEAARLIRLMKGKEQPSTVSYNNTMVPIMVISETDRSHIAGLLAMTELQNIKYGLHSFDEAFVNHGNPFFVGALSSGGAKALKTIDRERRNMPIKPHQRMTAAQRRQLHKSVSTFFGHLDSGRGKFRGLRKKDEVLNMFTAILVHRAGYLDATKARRNAAVTAARKIKSQLT